MEIQQVNFSPNNLFKTLCDLFIERVSPQTKVIVCNEGGSRSSKTWDAFQNAAPSKAETRKSIPILEAA